MLTESTLWASLSYAIVERKSREGDARHRKDGRTCGTEQIMEGKAGSLRSQSFKDAGNYLWRGPSFMSRMAGHDAPHVAPRQQETKMKKVGGSMSVPTRPSRQGFPLQTECTSSGPQGFGAWWVQNDAFVQALALQLRGAAAHPAEWSASVQQCLTAVSCCPCRCWGCLVCP